ncbi:hypothetical protein ACFXB3_02465 [Streptomyces sp. NPDC059447]|uniref:hypothetical protein n=1 Tax=Streptomyces sp. NPDC059447 TaxID=3346834 RepID=UPI0036CD3AAA
MPARSSKDEPEHYHLDIGYAFTTASAQVGRIQESEVTGVAWYPLDLAGRLVGPRIARAISAPAQAEPAPPEGYRLAIEAHRAAVPLRQADSGIAEAVKRQSAEMRELSRRAFPEPSGALSRLKGGVRDGRFSIMD